MAGKGVLVRNSSSIGQVSLFSSLSDSSNIGFDFKTAAELGQKGMPWAGDASVRACSIGETLTHEMLS